VLFRSGRGREHETPARALLTHLQCGGLGTPECAHDVDSPDIGEFFVAHLQEGAIAHDAGVRHERIDSSEGSDALPDDLLASLAISHIGCAGHRATALGGDLRHDLFGLIPVDIVHDHGSARPRQVEAMSPADTAPPTRDHGRSPCEYLVFLHAVLLLH